MKPRRIKENEWLVCSKITRQLQVRDIRFWKDEKILPRNSPLERLLISDSATINIYNQKNEHMGQTLHHESTGPKGAVASISYRVSHIMIHGGIEEDLLYGYLQT